VVDDALPLAQEAHAQRGIIGDRDDELIELAEQVGGDVGEAHAAR
jgi:hypothetical protein